MPKLRFKKEFQYEDLFDKENEILVNWRRTSVTPYKSNIYTISEKPLDMLKHSSEYTVYLNIKTNEFIELRERGHNDDLYPVKFSFFDILPDYEFKF